MRCRKNDEYYSNILGSCTPGITIQSLNKGTKRWGNRLGDYDLIDYDISGSAIYEHAINKGKFLYKINGFDNIWMVIDYIYDFMLFIRV